MLINTNNLYSNVLSQHVTMIHSGRKEITNNGIYDELFLTNYMGYRPNNSVSLIHILIQGSLNFKTPVIKRDALESFEPKTALGLRLLALRQAHLLNGGKLLNADEIDAELKIRRGGIVHA